MLWFKGADEENCERNGGGDGQEDKSGDTQENEDGLRLLIFYLNNLLELKINFTIK
uniref:Uncharacterized protein n=1 Tax=Meloidogyne enterolobii TaxID=390850 RepID=A0A6V7VKZ7_MELEN|nr:unnamed protein product [Meloidogyne enterolobii]